MNSENAPIKEEQKSLFLLEITDSSGKKILYTESLHDSERLDDWVVVSKYTRFTTTDGNDPIVSRRVIASFFRPISVRIVQTA